MEDWPPNYDTFTVVDTEAPTGTLVINNGALSTTFTGVRLALSGQDASGKVTRMRFSNDGTAWSDWETYADSKSWTLSNGDGLKTVNVQFMDEIGNGSVPVSASITLDLPAGGEYGFSINQGALFTNQTMVSLTIGAGPFTSEMMISNDGGFAGSHWEPYASKKSWPLSSHGDYVTPRIVYVKYKTLDGTILPFYQDDIILDVNPPQGSVRVVTAFESQVIISGTDLDYPGGLSNAGFKIFLPLIQKPFQGTLVKLELIATDDVSGLGHMMIGNDSDFSDAYWEPYQTPRDWGMTGSTVYVKFRDKAGNISIIYSASRP